MLKYKQIWHGIKPTRWLIKFNLTRTVKQNSFTPNSRIYETLEPQEQVSSETQQHNIIIICSKLVMHMEQAQCDQEKWNKAINHGLTIKAITIE